MVGRERIRRYDDTAPIAAEFIMAVRLAPVLALAAVERVDADGTLWVRPADGAALRARYALTRAALERAHAVQAPLIVADVGGTPTVLGILSDDVAEPAEREITASERMTLRCGEAALTFTADGTITLRGVRITSYADETNRIHGGQVRIN